MNIWIAGKQLIKPHYHLKKKSMGCIWNKNLGKYHNLHAQTDTLLLADVFENLRNKCLEIFELDPIYFVSAPGLAWKACLKKLGMKLELITDYNMLLMIEEGIRGGICQATHRYAKQIMNIWKIVIRTMNHQIQNI